MDPDPGPVPDLEPDPEFWWPKILKFPSWQKHKFSINNSTFLSLGLHEGCPSCRRSLQSSKENSQHFKTWTFFTVPYLSWPFLSCIRIQASSISTYVELRYLNNTVCRTGRFAVTYRMLRTLCSSWRVTRRMWPACMPANLALSSQVKFFLTAWGPSVPPGGSHGECA